MEEAESKRDRAHYREKEGTGNSKELGHRERKSQQCEGSGLRHLQESRGAQLMDEKEGHKGLSLPCVPTAFRGRQQCNCKACLQPLAFLQAPRGC